MLKFTRKLLLDEEQTIGKIVPAEKMMQFDTLKGPVNAISSLKCYLLGQNLTLKITQNVKML